MRNLYKYSYGLLGAVILTGCGGGTSSTASSSNNSVKPVYYQQPISIDAMAAVPVMNGASTKGSIFIHNYGDKDIKGAQFSLGNGTTKSKMKGLLAKVGVQLSGLEDTHGFILLNPERCSVIPAHGVCSLNFTTPELSLANQGNSLVKLSYSTDKGVQTTSQVVSYRYVGMDVSKGVNFTGGVTVAGTQGSIQHVVGYIYAGKNDGLYNNVQLASTNPTVTVSNGFINGRQLAPGEVVAVEFAVPMQNNKPGNFMVTPSWGQVSSLASKKASLRSGGVGSGTPFNGYLQPQQSFANYIIGAVPLLNAPTTSAAVVNVTNNGNGAAPGAITAEAAGGNAVDLTITNNCVGVTLSANAANSCSFEFSTASSVPGNTTVIYKDNSGVTIGQQQVYWTNDAPVPAIYVVPNAPTGSVSVGASQANNSIAFTVSNIGKAPLNNVSNSIFNTSANASWVQDTNSCGTTIAAQASCTISGHLTGVSSGTGDLYQKVGGDFNGTSYTTHPFISSPYSYTVTDAPSLAITPTGVTMTALANNLQIVEQIFTVENDGSVDAILDASPATLIGATNTNIPVPVIDSAAPETTCNLAAGQTLTSTQTCDILVKYGPIPVDETANDNGQITLDIAYHGGTPDTNYNAQDVIDYAVTGNDSNVQAEITANNGFVEGDGSAGDPYDATAENGATLTVTYTNPSVNFNMNNFNLQTNTLPLGLVVDNSSTCTTGASTMILVMGATCNLVLRVDRDTLKQTGSGNVLLNFTPPTASWDNALGAFVQPGDQMVTPALTPFPSPIYMNYTQPTVVPSFTTLNGGDITSITMGILVSDAASAGAGGFHVSVSPVTVTSTVDSGPCASVANAVECDFNSSNSTASITYTLPNGIDGTWAVLFSSPAYAWFNPGYLMIERWEI